MPQLYNWPMSVCEYDVGAVEAAHHVVQFYDAQEDALVANVGRYLLDGVKRSEALLIVAADERRAAFVRFLQVAGVDTDRILGDGMLEMLDAQQALDRFIVGGYPDIERFNATVGAAVRKARDRSTAGLRVYGEMVGLLWNRRQYPAAIRLEQLWHQLMGTVTFALFCAYEIDMLDASLDSGPIETLLCAHTHLLPNRPDDGFLSALQRGMEEVLGDHVAHLPLDAARMSGRGVARLPQSESTILWLRKHMPEHAAEIFRRARAHYRSPSGVAPPCSA